jgi:hypothetical protein
LVSGLVILSEAKNLKVSTMTEILPFVQDDNKDGLKIVKLAPATADHRTSLFSPLSFGEHFP